MSGDAKDRSTVTLVCAGAREGRKGLCHLFYELVGPCTRSEARRVYITVRNMCRPGGVFTFECDADNTGTIYPDTNRYQGQWHDETEILKWQAEHDAARTADTARKRRKKETGRNLVHEQLEPLRAAYRKSVGALCLSGAVTVWPRFLVVVRVSGADRELRQGGYDG